MSHTTWSLPNSSATVLTTELNSLATATYIISSSAYDNTSKLDLYANFVYKAEYSGGSPTAGTLVAQLYLLSSPDGTNYPSVDGSDQPQQSTFIGAFESRNASTSAFEYLVLTGVSLPPTKMKFVLYNASGQTLASSGNTVTIYPYQIQNV